MNKQKPQAKSPSSQVQGQQFQKLLKKQTIQTFENICKWLLITTCLIFTFLFYRLYLFQCQMYGVQKSMVRIYHFLTYGLFFSVSYTVLDFLCHHYLEDLVVKHFLRNETFQNKEALQKRKYTIVKWGFSMLFYSTCSIMGFCLLQGSSFAPAWMGGQQGYEKSEQYFFNDKQNTFIITFFYMIEFGKHFSRLIVHSFVRQEGKYYQFTLHHTLSVSLIIFSYLTNLWLPGMVVLLTHDSSDALFLIARFYKDFKYSVTLLVNFLGVLGLLSWIVFRGILYPLYLVYPVSKRFLFYLPENNVASDLVYWPGAYVCLMLWILLVMDYIWIFTMTKGLIVIIFPSKFKKVAKKNE